MARGARRLTRGGYGERKGLKFVEQVAKGRLETLDYSRRGRPSSRSEQTAKGAGPSQEQLLESR